MTTTTTYAKEENMDEMWGDKPQISNEVSERVKWFVDDKYSMFIHWGVYSEMGGIWKGKTHYGIGEWIMHMAKIPVDEYINHSKNFNPEKFDAKAIVTLAKNAGMKCIVITAKHHEGFAMFDSAASDYTITKVSPFGRDPMKELAKECKEAGIKLGFYYSQNQDWTEPYGGNYKGTRPEGYKAEDFNIYFEKKVIPQVTELLTNYGDIAVVWFDTPGKMDKSFSEALVNLVQKHQPNCLINSRIGNGYGDYASLGDMQIPLTRNPGAWESIDTTNDSWAYAWYDEHWKSAKKIAENLISVVARGGSYMLNIGPKGDGTVPEEAVRNLTDAGKWIKANAEAIYETSPSPYLAFDWGVCTVKGNDLYVHLFNWPESGELILPALKNKVKKAAFLCCGTKIKFKQLNDRITLQLEGKPKDTMIPVLKIALDGKAEASSQALTIDGQHPTKLEAIFAKTKGASHEEVRWMEKFGEWKHSDNIAKWKTKEDRGIWQINVLKTGRYNVRVDYACSLKTDDSEWVINSESDSITFVAIDSGMRERSKAAPRKRARYQDVELGPLTFDKTGIQTISIQSRHTPKNDGIYIRRITIEPYEL